MVIYLAVVGLRASYTVASILDFVAFGGPAIYAMAKIWRNAHPWLCELRRRAPALFRYFTSPIYKAGRPVYPKPRLTRSFFPPPDEMIPIGLWLIGLGGMVFMGGRVILALRGVSLPKDSSVWDSLRTGSGFLIMTIGVFLPAWSKARANGNGRYGIMAFSLIAGCGIAFALFYRALHALL